MYRLSLLPRQGMHGNRKEMNALTGNNAALLISCSIDMNALTGNAQNHAACSNKTGSITNCVGKDSYTAKVNGCLKSRFSV
jgi:hypothetical protein